MDSEERLYYTERELLKAFKFPGKKEKALQLLREVPDPKKILDPDGQCLLHFACDRNWKGVVELLLTKYNFDPHFEDEFGGTALRDACAQGYTELARYLMEEWCVDPTKKDKSGKSPLDECKNWNKFETQMCIESIIDDANKNGYEDVGQYLRDHSRSVNQSVLARAMQEGGGQLHQSNIVMHGPPGAGKTSVMQLIAGLPPLSKEKQNATNIMEKTVRAVRINKLKSFEVVEDDQLIQMLAEEIKSQQCVEKQEDQIIVHSDENVSTKQPTIQAPYSNISSEGSGTLASSTSVSFESTPGKSKVVKKLLELLKVSKPSSSMFNSQWFHLIDSGGQPQFSDILPLVYSSPSLLHIVVIRLTEQLEDKPKVLFYTEGCNSYSLPEHLSLTNREIIIRTCEIASSTVTDEFTPLVLIVATHKDLLGEHCEAKIKQIDQGLAEVQSEFKDVLICKSRDEIVFAINAIAEGKERELYIQQLQKVITMHCTKSATQTGVPLRWLGYYLDLGESNGVVRMSECYKKGKLLKLNDDDVRKVLMFLKHAALILYFPKDVPNLIMTTMDPFIGPLSNLVKESFIVQELSPHGGCERLREKGLFNRDFLRKVLGDCKTSSLTENEFIDILLCLKIAVSVGNEEYFLPSALSLKPFPESTFEMTSNPLAFTWDGKILPHGFFFTVVVELLRKPLDRDRSYSFELRTDVPQWRGEIQFTEVNGKIPGVIKLTNQKRWIQLSYSDDNIYCADVCKVVHCAIQRSIQRFQHTGIGNPDINHLCSQCEKKDHYCLVAADNNKATCSITKTKTCVLTDNMLCWMKDEKIIGDSSVTVSEQSQDHAVITLPPVDDTLLSEENLLEVLESTIEVGNWKNLGLKLGLKNSKLDAIDKDERSEDDRKRNMFTQWLKHPNASWSTLVNALNSSLVDQGNLARRIAEKHPKHS